MRRTIAIACTTAALAAPALAQAHVTLQPEEVPAGGFTRLDVRVPNERDDASTVKVEVQFPAGFQFASTEPVPGWTAKVTRKKLAEPVTDHGEQVTDRVDTITWTGQRRRGTDRPRPVPGLRRVGRRAGQAGHQPHVQGPPDLRRR